MKSTFTLFLSLLFFSAFGQLVITEISYNPPESGTDTTEYIEIYNNSTATVDLTDYSMNGVELVFDEVMMMPGEFLLVSVNPNAMQSLFGLNAIGFTGALTNGGELLEILDASGNVVDMVDYGDAGAWPSSASGTDGAGASIELCDVNADNNNGDNWRAADNGLGVSAEGNEYLGTPGAANTVECADISYTPTSIGDATAVDADGDLVNPGATVQLEGVVYGVNINPSGLQFTLVDESNEGVGIWSQSESFGYEVNHGDRLVIQGAMSQFNGLTQILPASITVMSSGNSLPSATVITTLDESTESSVISFMTENMTDVPGWGDGSSGFNAIISNGTEMITVRVDADTDVFNLPSPANQGVCIITGVGGQFDGDAPYTEGYQLSLMRPEDLQCATSTDDLTIKSTGLTVFPNPVSDYIVWNVDTKQQVQSVSILDAAGRLIYYVDYPEKEINVTSLKTGMYSLVVHLEDGQVTSGFLKR